MDRREILQLGTAALAAAAFSKAAQAQNAPAAAPAASGFALSAYSRNLQWLRTPQQLGKGIADMALSRVDLTVSSASGHVDPARVATDLPTFVNGLKQAGISVSCITTDIVDATSPNAEDILKAASAAGITHYVWGGLTYNEAQPYQAQLDALRPRVQALARLNERYKIKGLYQPQRGAASVGSGFFDIYQVLRNFDPRYVGIHYNCANLLQATPATMAVQLRTGGAYIGGVAITDADVKLVLPEWKQGPFTYDPNALIGHYTGGDYTGGQDSDPMILGGGGRPLPYRYSGVRVGTGMVDLMLLGKTLKEINFSGPAETQVNYELGGAEKGATQITAERLNVLGQIKRDKLLVEQAFADIFNINIARPPFVERQRSGAQAPAAGRGGGGGGGGGGEG